MNALRGFLYSFARLLGDINAIKRNRVRKRIERRIVGKIAGRILRGILR